MPEYTDTEALFVKSREIRSLFDEVVEPHRVALWRYCLRLTASPWDAEDLFQETLMKAFATLPQLWNPIVPKSYLFRIATNTWIDVCRKRGVTMDAWTEETANADAGKTWNSPPSLDIAHAIEVRDAVETLVTKLPPRQLVSFLLMDVFEFSAREIAGMMHCSEGAVYAAVQRARARLRALGQGDVTMAAGENADHARSGDTAYRVADVRLDGASIAVHRLVEKPAPNVAVSTIIQALNTGDVTAFLRTMSEHVHNDGSPGFQEFSKQEVSEGSGQGLPSGLHASYCQLWGRDIIFVLAETDDGLAIHNIAYPVVDDGAITYFRGYYFCKELLFEVGCQFGLPVQLNKPAVDWR